MYMLNSLNLSKVKIFGAGYWLITIASNQASTNSEEMWRRQVAVFY